MKLVLFAISLLLALPATAASGWQWNGDIVGNAGPWKREPVPPRAHVSDDEDCRAKIAKVLCLVDGDRENNFRRECLPETADYVPTFEALYDRIPGVLQKMFCSLERLFIEKDLDSTAYALQHAPIIGIRASLIDKKLSLSDWSTWKEQLSFGGSLRSYDVKTDLPTYESNGTAQDFLYSVIVHEFGHLFDFANGVNSRSGGWMALSWDSLTRPKAGNTYPNRTGMCFYHCGSRRLAKSDVPSVYEGLYAGTNFLNTYTARNAYEDWADSFSFYFLFGQSSVGYSLNTAQGKTYDLRAVLDSDRFAPKKKFIEAFVGRSDVKYP